MAPESTLAKQTERSSTYPHQCPLCRTVIVREGSRAADRRRAVAGHSLPLTQYAKTSVQRPARSEARQMVEREQVGHCGIWVDSRARSAATASAAGSVDACERSPI